MSTDPGIWGWTSDIGQLGFTVTFSWGRDPQEVLNLYGIDPLRAEQASRDDALAIYPPSYGGVRLRAGMLGRWAFCFEEAGVEGMQASTLSGLSADTETIALCTVPGLSSFIFLKDGQGVEAFELGQEDSVRGAPPLKFWNGTKKILERSNTASPTAPVHAVLQAITKHVREPLDRATLEGRLLTAYLADSDRTPMPTQFYEAHPSALLEPVGENAYFGPPSDDFGPASDEPPLLADPVPVGASSGPALSSWEESRVPTDDVLERLQMLPPLTPGGGFSLGTARAS